MSVAEIILELSRLTAAERSAIRQHLREMEEQERQLSLHEPAVNTPALEQIESQVKQLSKAEQETLRDWLENVLEDYLEFTDEFKKSIERGSSAGKKSLSQFFSEWDATHSVSVGEKPTREGTYATNPRLR